jgi:hypothetical protein
MVAPEGTTVSRLESVQLVSLNGASMPSDLTRMMSLTGAEGSGVGAAEAAATVAVGAPVPCALAASVGPADAPGEEGTADDLPAQAARASVVRLASASRAPLRIGGRS